ncbi:unnamed protein product [Mycena citricolor]|uniref:SEP-domain-containing protein n=1 Tax=Mycena citricolor TaxID=2018698 RepID=A0AAD2HF37_9AGAR|nr:unnamed protein product [Mycena citricolor]CAK5273664.1 unnamed protein product [Mycena citricolor]
MADSDSRRNSARGFRPSGPVRVGRIGGWSSGTPAPSSSSHSGGPRIGTMRDIGSGAASSAPRPPPGQHQGQDHDDEDDEESDEDDGDERQPQSYFAGGERSGISVQNPDSGPRRRDGPAGMVRDLLRRAAEAGPSPSSIAATAPPTAFFGGANTLGSDEVESRFIPDPNAAPTEGDDGDLPRVTRYLTFWASGFTVDAPNEPLGSGTGTGLMRFDDPQNAEVLAALRQGLAPPEILNVLSGQPVEVVLSDRSHEEYVPPRTVWSGGNRLGAVVPGQSSSSSSSSAMPGSFTSAASPVQASTAAPTVDASQPVAQIQVRLATGGRLAARLNHTHTVADLRAFIDSQGGVQQQYILQTTFPTKELNDDQTISSAGLAGSVVVQRLV